MTESSADGALDGIRGQFRGYVDTAPRVRYRQTGELVWEFQVRLVDSLNIMAELVVVRAPDERYAQLQKWVAPGRQLLVDGVVHVARWQTHDGRARVCLLVDPVRELMPLDTRARGSEPAALVYDPPYRPRPRQQAPSPTAAPTTTAERAARVRALLEETPMP